MSAIRSSDKNSSIIYDRLPIERQRSVSPLSTNNQSPLLPQRTYAINPTPTSRPIYTTPSTSSQPIYVASGQQLMLIANPAGNIQPRPSYYGPQSNIQYVPQTYLPNTFQPPYTPYNGSLSNIQSLPIMPVNAQPYSGSQFLPQPYPSASLGNPYHHIVGYK